MSNAYQLSSHFTSAPWNESWTPYFARHLPQRLPAEQLLDAITKATSVPQSFPVSGLGMGSSLTFDFNPSDLIYETSCHLCGSGNFDQTGIPCHTTPFVSTQKIAPGVASCTSALRIVGARSVPSAVCP